eukprot:m.77468 g.77468  ORF g.77468 m.77468 type:complete len:937 (-) comp13215_c0_seq3:33-2843(-)
MSAPGITPTPASPGTARFPFAPGPLRMAQPRSNSRTRATAGPNGLPRAEARPAFSHESSRFSGHAVPRRALSKLARAREDTAGQIMLKKITVGLHSTLDKVASSTHGAVQPIRIMPKHRRKLTSPGKPVWNEYDNVAHDYILRVGETIEGARYQFTVQKLLGKGTFGQAVKCKCEQTGQLVAIKIVKNHHDYTRQAKKEIEILTMLGKTLQPRDAHLITLLGAFVFREHTCLVFELLNMNLLEYLQQHRDKGLDLRTIRTICRQLLVALDALVAAGVIHCDLKPENVLLEESPQTSSRCNVRVIDFGSACMHDDDIHTYIQSRFYRAPEVLLGARVTSAIDTWSLGCIVAELFLGRPLFAGSSEYDQLVQIQSLLGPLPPVLLQGRKASLFFMCDETGYSMRSFAQYSVSIQSSTGKPVKEPHMGARFRTAQSLPEFAAEMLPTDPANASLLADFLSLLLALDPAKRASPREALMHRFLLDHHPSSSVYNSPATSRMSSPLVPSSPMSLGMCEGSPHVMYAMPSHAMLVPSPAPMLVPGHPCYLVHTSVPASPLEAVRRLRGRTGSDSPKSGARQFPAGSAFGRAFSHDSPLKMVSSHTHTHNLSLSLSCVYARTHFFSYPHSSRFSLSGTCSAPRIANAKRCLVRFGRGLSRSEYDVNALCRCPTPTEPRFCPAQPAPGPDGSQPGRNIHGGYHSACNSVHACVPGRALTSHAPSTPPRGGRGCWLSAAHARAHAACCPRLDADPACPPGSPASAPCTSRPLACPCPRSRPRASLAVALVCTGASAGRCLAPHRHGAAADATHGLALPCPLAGSEPCRARLPSLCRCLSDSRGLPGGLFTCCSSRCFCSHPHLSSRISRPSLSACLPCRARVCCSPTARSWLPLPCRHGSVAADACRASTAGFIRPEQSRQSTHGPLLIVSSSMLFSFCFYCALY